jgi:hypothetical protein
MMSKTKFAGVKIKELLSWFVGFKEEGKTTPPATTTSGVETGQVLAAAVGQ